MRVIVLNGVNLNILGRRDPSIYGGLSIAELEGRIYEWGRELELAVQCRQTNMEGEFVKWCHDAHDNTDGMILNPGAWTHYAWSIHDALEPLEDPARRGAPLEPRRARGLAQARPSSATSSPHASSARAPTATGSALEYLKENA